MTIEKILNACLFYDLPGQTRVVLFKTAKNLIDYECGITTNFSSRAHYDTPSHIPFNLRNEPVKLFYPLSDDIILVLLESGEIK